MSVPDPAAVDWVPLYNLQSAIPPVVNGQWVKGSGGVAIWAAITPADITGLVSSGTRAAKPTAASAGRGARYYETDWGQTWSSDGAVWTRIGQSYLPRVAPGAQVDNLIANAVDGDEYLLTDSAASPTYVWRFRLNTGSSSAYKWEFQGGAPLTSYVTGTETVTGANVWTSAPSSTPQIPVGRSGEYIVGGGVSGYGAAGTISVLNMGVAVDNNTPPIWAVTQFDNTNQWGSTSINGVLIAIGAGHYAKMQFNQSVSPNNVSSRWLSVTPVRIA